MAVIPIYDIATLPCITYPMDNVIEETKRYLGRYASTGTTSAGLNVIPSSDAQAKALYDFWRVTCNNGLEPFLIPLPLFGSTVANPATPSILVKFKGALSMSKQDIAWTCKFDVEVYGLVIYVIDDQGNFVTSDQGEYAMTPDGNYAPTGNIINTYRGVVYG